MYLLFVGFLKNYWKQLIVIVLITISLCLVYNKIYSLGYDAANIECEARMKEYSDKLDKRISELESSSNQLVLESIESRNVLKKDFTSILLTIKGKPLYVIEQGVCKPSQDFIKVYNEAVDRANK